MGTWHAPNMLGSKNTQPARFGVDQGPVQGGLACLLQNVWGARGRAGIQLTCWGACRSASPPPLPPTNSGRFGLPGDTIEATLLPGAAHCPPLTATLTALAAPVPPACMCSAPTCLCWPPTPSCPPLARSSRVSGAGRRSTENSAWGGSYVGMSSDWLGILHAGAGAGVATPRVPPHLNCHT